MTRSKTKIFSYKLGKNASKRLSQVLGCTESMQQLDFFEQNLLDFMD